MAQITITADASPEDLLPIAMCVHELFGGLPVTARSRDRPGVQVENGKVKSRAYTGPILEQVVRESRTVRGKPPSGAYKGIPVVVAPILAGGEAIAAMGVVDTSGSLDIKAFMDQYSTIQKQVTQGTQGPQKPQKP
jgi:hypothetical protein